MLGMISKWDLQNFFIFLFFSQVDLKLMQAQIAELQQKVSVLEGVIPLFLVLILLLICYICFDNSRIIYWLIVIVTLCSGPFLALRFYYWIILLIFCSFLYRASTLATILSWIWSMFLKTVQVKILYCCLCEY